MIYATKPNSNMDAGNSFHWNTRQFSLLSSTLTNNTANFSNLTLTDYKYATIGFGTHPAAQRSWGVPALLREGTTDGTTDALKTWFDNAGKSAVLTWGRTGPLRFTFCCCSTVPPATI